LRQKCQAKKMLERFALGWFGFERQSPFFSGQFGLDIFG
jgi:hypothetical protein